MKKIGLMLLILMCLVYLPSALAIGISPSNLTIQFEPGLEKEVKYLAINNEEKDLDADLGVIGSYSEFVQLEQTSIHLEPDEYEKMFIVKIKLPEKTKACGVIAKVLVRETSSKQASGIVVLPQVLSRIELINPGGDCAAKDITGGATRKIGKIDIIIPLIIATSIIIFITLATFYKIKISKRRQRYY